MKRLYSLIAIVAIVSMLFAFPKAAYAFDTCAPRTLTMAPASITHAFYAGTYGDFYLNKYQYQVVFNNTSGHTCKVEVDVHFTTNNGWYSPDYYLFNTAKGHVPYTNSSFAGLSCTWIDSTHRDTSCVGNVYSGSTSSLLIYWAHPNPLTSHDSAKIDVWTTDTSGAFYQGGQTFDVY